MDSLAVLLDSQCHKDLYFTRDSSSSLKFTINTDVDNLENDILSAIRSEGFFISTYRDMVFALRKGGMSTSLPDNYFSSATTALENTTENEYYDALAGKQETADFQNKIYEIGNKDKKEGGSLALSGYIRNVNTGEPAVGISVYQEKKKIFTTTDNFGYYKLVLPAGENVLKINDLTYEEATFNVIMYQSGSLDMSVKEKAYSLKGATVSAESYSNRRTNKIGVELVRISRIKKVPSVFGEADVVKIILTLPGVQSVGEASGGFNVRGGATDQNLILFNDGTIYNPNHLFGMFSAFNPDVITDIELYKSSIPAPYGGRISSVLEIRGKEGNSKKITGSAGIGLLTAKAHIEGPISSKTRFIVGARTTYSDWILKLLPSESGYSNGTASFFDVNASISHDFNKKNTLYAYGYYSRDGFKFSADTSYKYDNVNASLKWRSIFNERNNMVVSAGYDQYRYNTFDKSNSTNSYNLAFGIKQAFMKATFTSMFSDKHILTYGVHGIFYHLNPGEYLPYGDSSLVVPAYLPLEQAFEVSAFISDTWNISEKISADLGIRYSNFIHLNPTKYYGGPEFRISGKYLISESFTFKAGFNSMRQYIHMLSNTTSISPTDIWKLSDENIKPQSGWQAAVALYSTQFDNKVEFSLEGYYKEMSDYLDYKSGAVLVMNENIAEDVITTKGRAYGVEFMAKKPLGKLNGWVSYSYSKTMLRENGRTPEEAINGGNWYPAPYDKPHNVKLVGNYKITHRLSVSMNVDYSTGRPVTVPISKYYYGGGYRLYYSDRNAYRIPDYFRLDLSMNIEPSHYIKQLSHFSFTVGVYNVTGRKNAYSVYYNTSGGSEVHGYKLCIFGAPIPYLNINVRF